MTIRYMGTKRHVAPHVRRIVGDIKPKGRVVDLFSGMGCVTEGLAGLRSVVTNDALAFTASFSRARFTATERLMSPGEAIDTLRGAFREHNERLTKEYRPRLREEQRALAAGRAQLAGYMADAEHVANSDAVARRARRLSKAAGAKRYELATLYFSAGYFGLRQAIQLDSLRFAIDEFGGACGDRDWLMAAWLGAAATVANAPGHTAQYLKPNTEQAYLRIRRYWRRNIWTEFQDRLIDLKPVGTKAWRRRNRVETSDALGLIASGRLGDAGAVYADPPYTKDQYSRYYHVYETLYRYDFPDAYGEARARSDRFATDFCLKSGVVGAFEELFESVAALRIPLVLSYPSAGLLADAGSTVRRVAKGRLTIDRKESFRAEHSTLGASQGSKTKPATENIYVCRPT